jgi:hypothetical protein
MTTIQGFGLTIRYLENAFGVHKLDDSHCVLFVEPGYTSGEVTGILVEA